MPQTFRPSTDPESLCLPGLPPLPPGASVGKRWRFRRNLVIYLAHRRNGLSQRFLADVFDLPRSRIGDIIREFEQYDPSSEGFSQPQSIPA